MSMQPYPMNREQRRKHYREAKKDPIAVYCPHCTHKTRHVAIPTKTKEGQEKKLCDIVCVACGNVLRTSMPNLVPYEYVQKVDSV